MNDCDWWADFSLEEAKINYPRFTGMPTDEAWDEEDNPSELTPEEMQKTMFSPDPYDEPNVPKRTFQEELDKNIKEGKTEPFFFASTEF